MVNYQRNKTKSTIVVRRRYTDGETVTDMLHVNARLGSVVQEAEPDVSGDHVGTTNGYVTNADGEPFWVDDLQPTDENHIQYHGGFLEDSEHSPPWQASERSAIERGAHLNELPMPGKHQKASIGILDYPYELSKFYSEKDKELEQSLAILDAIKDAGYNFTVINADEIAPYVTAGSSDGPEINPPKWLQDIQFIVPLAGNLSEYNPKIVIKFFEQIKNFGIEPFILPKRLIDSFIFNEYDDEIVRREISEKFAQRGIKKHWLWNNKCHIVVNWPYVFVKVSSRDFISQDLRINLQQFDDAGPLLSGSENLMFYDVYNDRNFKHPIRLDQVSGELDFTLSRDRRDTYLLVWAPKVDKHKETVISRRLEIDQYHRLSTMKRSLPIALILTVVAITIGAIYMAQLYHPTVAKKKKKRRKPLPVIPEHEDYFVPDE